MRKFRKAMFILTIIFAILTIIGITALILSSRGFADLVIDAILLLISASSIAIALLAQIGLERETRRIDKLIHNVNDIDEHTEEDLKTDNSFRRKLDEVLSLEKEIYAEVTKGHKDSGPVEKSTKNK